MKIPYEELSNVISFNFNAGIYIYIIFLFYFNNLAPAVFYKLYYVNVLLMNIINPNHISTYYY